MSSAINLPSSVLLAAKKGSSTYTWQESPLSEESSAQSDLTPLMCQMKIVSQKKPNLTILSVTPYLKHLGRLHRGWSNLHNTHIQGPYIEQLQCDFSNFALRLSYSFCGLNFPILHFESIRSFPGNGSRIKFSASLHTLPLSGTNAR